MPLRFSPKQLDFLLKYKIKNNLFQSKIQSDHIFYSILYISTFISSVLSSYTKIIRPGHIFFDLQTRRLSII